MRTFPGIAITVAAFLGAVPPVSAKSSWSTASHPSLDVRPSGEDVDALIRASCAFDGLMILRVGAEFQVGQGKGEPVSVTIESGGKSSKLQGVSRWSPDSEMTGGTELVTELPLHDPALDILFSGKPVTMITQDQKKHQLLDADRGGVGKKFLKQCGRV